MDTMGALALGTEQPTEALLQRPPYKREASLLSRPIIRNILSQSLFQLVLLLLLLTLGDQWFHVERGNVCEEFGGTDRNHWGWLENGNYKGNGNGVVGCPTFLNGILRNGSSPLNPKLDCSDDRDQACYDKGYGDFAETNKHFTFEHVCLVCKKHDYTHFTIIFNTFVFCQLFNELNARSITDDWRILRGIHTNYIFVSILVFTTFMQVFIVEVGGEFTKTTGLSAMQWVRSAGLGLIAIPVGFLMRFIPVKEDPRSFAHPPG